MRLSVFIANTLSTQLLTDLQKIYADYLPPAALTEEAISTLIAEPTTRLYMTMFNDRHIGAAKVSIEGSQATLTQLTVRDLTRRRGVGKNLLTQIQKSLSADNITHIRYDLQEVSEVDLLATTAFLLDSGFDVEEKIATKHI